MRQFRSNQGRNPRRNEINYKAVSYTLLALTIVFLLNLLFKLL